MLPFYKAQSSAAEAHAAFNATYEEISNKFAKSLIFNPGAKQLLHVAKTPNLAINRIVIIGCGGTGSWLAPKLVKTVNDMHSKGLLAKTCQLIFVDGDIVEQKNLIRQNFIVEDINKNKAQVLADRYSHAIHGDIEVSFVDKYIVDKFTAEKTSEKFIEAGNLIYGSNSTTIVFNLIDNSVARKTAHFFAAQNYTQVGNRNRVGYQGGPIFVVDVGNDAYNGQLNTSIYPRGEHGRAIEVWNKTPQMIRRSVFGTHTGFYSEFPEHVTLEDDVSIYSCAEADADVANQDQMLVANDFAATIANNWLASYSVMMMQQGVPTFFGSCKFVAGTMPSINSVKQLLTPYADMMMHRVAGLSLITKDTINFTEVLAPLDRGLRSWLIEEMNSKNESFFQVLKKIFNNLYDGKAIMAKMTSPDFMENVRHISNLSDLYDRKYVKPLSQIDMNMFKNKVDAISIENATRLVHHCMHWFTNAADLYLHTEILLENPLGTTAFTFLQIAALTD